MRAKVKLKLDTTKRAKEPFEEVGTIAVYLTKAQLEGLRKLLQTGLWGGSINAVIAEIVNQKLRNQ